MATLSNGGFFNPAYHDSETLELDKRFSSRTHHANPYAREDPTWRGERASSERGVGTGHWVGWQEDANRDTIAMDVVSTGPRSPVWQRDLNQTTFQTSPESHYDPSHSVRFPSAVSGNMTMRWRGMAMRRMSMFGHSDPALAFTEDALMHEMENEEQNLVKELVAMSTRERIQAIRDLPLSCEDKKQIRNQVLAFKSSKQSHGLTCLTDCSEDVSLFFRRFGYAVCSARQTLELWQGTMKEIGGRFGTSVLSYFVFLKWLLMFNIFSFLVNFGFITIPLLVYEPSPSTPENVTFRGLEILTGAGYFNSTVMYYGGYSNETITHLVDYNMQLAYFFTIAVYMVLCGLALLISMASSFRRNYVLSDASSCSAWQLLCSWDFSVTNEKAVRRGKNNLRVQLKESLSEKAQGERLTFSEKMKRFGVHVLCWFLSTGLTIGCGAAIYYLCQFEQQRATDATSWTPLQEAETLLVPFVVSLINLVVPLFYSLVNKFENYSSQRSQIYALVLRNVLLKMSILAVLCYYWMNVVAVKFSCWESMVGQALYRLVIFDFLFLMLGSFFGEFLSNVIGTRVLPRLGVPEFDVARNVLELIYAQTLAWIGIYFAPLLPVIQIAKFFILFYLKKVSLTQNCQPPRRSGRAAQMQTIFIAILFFPSFVGGLSVVAYTAWSLTPSEYCGPFRGLNSTFSVVNVWIEDLQDITGSEWVIWIYQHVIRSELFFFLITLIILVIIYIFWQITRGRKQLIGRLRQYIVNEGKDKSFLLEKLQNLQKSGPQKKRKLKNQNKLANQHFGDHSSSSQSSSDAMAQILLARRQFELEEESEGSGGLPVPSDLTTPSPSTALMQAMLARHRAEEQDSDYYQLPGEHSSSSGALAQVMQARQRAENQDGDYHLPDEHSASSGALAQVMQAWQRAEDQDGDYYQLTDEHSASSGALAQAMQARQRAEEGDRIQVFAPPTQEPAPPGSSALIQAMLARQQAQNEYDDGY